MATRKQDGSEGIGRRTFLGSALAAAAGGLVANRVLTAETVRAATPFDVEVLVTAGLFALDRASKSVDVAYPGKTGAPCNSDEHPMRLELLTAGKVTVTGNVLEKQSPWKLSGYAVKLEVPGSTTKPDPGRWREVPRAKVPATTGDFAEVDWIPTINGGELANDWKTLALARLTFPTGEWRAEEPQFAATYGHESWELVDRQNKVIRRQYVTDLVALKDRSNGGPVVFHFYDKAGADVGSVAIEPAQPGAAIQLAVTTDAAMGEPELPKGQKVKHYCMWYALLKPVKRPFDIRRTKKKFKAKGPKALVLKQGGPIPGKFCPGGKVIFG